MKTMSLTWQARETKINLLAFFISSFALVLSGCASWEAGGKVERGRYALLRGDSQLAASYFESATKIDANYMNSLAGPINEGVWTYLGRAYYNNGDYKAALKALEQARESHPGDPFAPLYLGLALAKDGDRQRAVKEIHVGLTRLNASVEDMARNSLQRVYWDPGNRISAQIQKDLASINSKEFNWNDLIASAEQVGLEIEEEVNIVRREMRRDLSDGDDNDGNRD